MYVKINRNTCGHAMAKCERCLGKFLREPLGYERQCFEVVEDDDSELLTLDITDDDHHLYLQMTKKDRDFASKEGWFVWLSEVAAT